ncbi:MAG TPA: 6-bladed beta-propeller [Longimicrobium sp.]|nr:6-bladed beta-propeller [Longimicrobium sp.]
MHSTRSRIAWPCSRVIAVVSVFLCACGRDETDVASQRGVWEPGEEWQLEEETRIGAADGEGPDAFAKVVDVTLDPMGRAWVADAQRFQIQVFDATGKHVRSIGRKGAGPAEFGAIAGMAWGPNDQLWVLDGANARFAVYDTAGTLVTTRPRSSIITVSPWPGRVDEQGRVYDVAAVPRPDGSITSLIVRSDSAGQPRDTFHLPEFRPDVFSITQGDKQNQRITQVAVPFTGRQAWTIDPEGYVWIANTGHYRIERHAFGGGVERVIERNPPPVPVTPEERSQMLENYRRYTEQGIEIDVSRIPRHHPPLSSFLFDDAGNLWVSPITSPDEGRALDVFDPKAVYLGRVRLPATQRTALKTVRGDRMALVARDSLDVQSVIVMRIKKPQR